MIFMKGSLKNDSSLVATLATIGNLFIGKIPKWPQNDVIHFGCFYVFHKILSVIYVIRVLGIIESISSPLNSITTHILIL